MQEIYIKAYTKMNFGDDWLMQILVKRYPDVKFVLCAPAKYKKIFRNEQNVRIIATDSLGYKILNKLINIKSRLTKHVYPIWFEDYISAYFRKMIYIGGSIFIEKTEEKIARYEQEWWEHRIADKESIFVLDANFGPFFSKEYINSMTKILSKCKDVCFREIYSKNLFTGIENIRSENDIAFIEATYPHSHLAKRYIVVVVVHPEKNYHCSQDIHNKYIEKMAEISIYAEEVGLSTKYVSFCEKEGDDIAMFEIRGILKDKNVDFISYKGDISQIKELVKYSSGIVTSRFHGMILGINYNKPIYLIAYSEKGIHVIEENNLNIPYMRLLEIQNMDIRVFIHDIKEYKNDFSDIEYLRMSAEKQFAVLDEVMNAV